MNLWAKAMHRFIIQINLSPFGGNRYYDPSYGLTYKNDRKFETTAVYGYALLRGNGKYKVWERADYIDRFGHSINFVEP